MPVYLYAWFMFIAYGTSSTFSCCVSDTTLLVAYFLDSGTHPNATVRSLYSAGQLSLQCTTHRLDALAKLFSDGSLEGPRPTRLTHGQVVEDFQMPPFDLCRATVFAMCDSSTRLGEVILR
ncbi:hypothetical protein JB92DRAFT_3041809 [Gautieria morchelliformis]|nr:hypothetical protein JB92DRAFT_3041809 [Gautieria morchelliformis]